MTKRLNENELSKIMKMQLMMIRVMLNQQQMTATMEILLEHAKKFFGL